MTIRFGHAESPEGPNGENTVFLVRATDYQEAANVTDTMLLNMPTTSPHSEYAVESLCHRVIELGEDLSAVTEPQILGGPWIGQDYHTGSTYPMWVRGDVSDDWLDAKDVFTD